MNQEELRAQTEADFTIEMETNDALRILVNIVGRPKANMLWTMGYVKGQEKALAEVLATFPRPV
jgi:hypothetical protein